LGISCEKSLLTTDIKLPGYHEPCKNDRNCFGGGVLVYTADYLHVLRRNDLEFNGGELIIDESLLMVCK
jgi:alpha-acetolactate decarboxylase